MGLPPTYFCSQDCFRTNYASHNKIHKVAKQVMEAKKAAANAHRKTPPDGITCGESEDMETKMSLPLWAEHYDFTGDLRPALLSPKRQLPSSIPRPDYANDIQGISMSEQRDRATNKAIRIYGPNELDCKNGLRHACAMGREVLDIAGRALKPGVTTDEIDKIVHDACIERGCYPSPLNYYNFRKSWTERVQFRFNKFVSAHSNNNNSQVCMHQCK